MESQEVEENHHNSWMTKRDISVNGSSASNSGITANMSEASGSSSSSHSRQGPSATKRTLSEPVSVRQVGPSPVKRQYQASNSPDDGQLKELDRLEKKEASLVNQLLHQLQLLHKRCNEERHQIVEEQRHLAERLEQIDTNEKTEEQTLREKNSRKLEEVRMELLQLRQQMSLEGSTSSNSSGLMDSVVLSSPSTSGRCDFSHALEIRHRLVNLDRQRQALLEQLYTATGPLSQGSSQVMDLQLHICAPGRDVAGSSTLSERVLPTSQQSEIAASSPESSEQAQSSGEEDSEISSSSDILLPQNMEIVSDQSSASGSHGRGGNSSPKTPLGLEAEPEDDVDAANVVKEEPPLSAEKKNEIGECILELDDEGSIKKKEKDNDLDLALLKLKNIGALVEEELQCSICNELLVAAVTINCAHSFCKHCLGEWKKQRAECPMCRMPITAEHRSVTLDSLISTMVGQLSLELQQRHKEVVEERAALEAAAAAATNASSGGNLHGRQGSSSSQDHNSTSQGSQGRASRHQNYNNNHWQSLPPPHHHPHPHHHSFAHPPNPHVAHYNPHSHATHAHTHTLSHPPHAHNHAPHAHNYPPHAHNHPPHAHSSHTHNHPGMTHPPYLSLLPSLSHPPHAHPQHNTPPPRTPPGLGLGHSQGPGPSGLQSLPNIANQAQHTQHTHTHEALDHHIRVRRRHGRNMVSSSSSSGSSTEEPSDASSSFSSTAGFSSPSERTWFESDYGEYEDEEHEGEPRRIVPGIPGRYYGGYGVCFYCNQRGHWSNGCPVRFGF